MATTSINPTKLGLNGSVADPEGTATGVGAGNGVVVSGVSESLVLRLVATDAATVTVKAGSQPSAISSGQGDLTVELAASGVAFAGPFESARFQQPDGSVLVESTAAVTVTAFEVVGK